jgi:hypothetical protein
MNASKFALCCDFKRRSMRVQHPCCSIIPNADYPVALVLLRRDARLSRPLGERHRTCSGPMLPTRALSSASSSRRRQRLVQIVVQAISRSLPSHPSTISSRRAKNHQGESSFLVLFFFARSTSRRDSAPCPCLSSDGRRNRFLTSVQFAPNRASVCVSQWDLRVGSIAAGRLGMSVPLKE